MPVIDAKLLKILVCPQDRGPLLPVGDDWLYNARLHRKYRIDDGIPVLLVDEAHGLGVRGTGGRGLLHEAGLAGAPDVVMTTTLSKALGKQAFYRQIDLVQDDAYDFAVERMASASLLPDAQESIAAFLEKRPAKFTGR